MKNSIDKIYESSVFGKPSIHLDPLEAAPTTGQKKTSEREQVINSYLPERFHTNKTPFSNNVSKNTGTSLKEKYKANASPDIEKQFINLLESYFSSNRHTQLGNLEEVMEDMYSFLKENQ
jgi:hypothetical protein